ncbi:LysE family transporter [Oribacterium sp. HCP28S3_H8]|uniref:LysE family transporter n=1 Tax=Oribacterium sp. HCP28S3_H8 TaxID=3438945 RepID=UPI003F8C2622
MPGSIIPSFLFYCFINGITPGPANLTSLNAALRYGRDAALRQWSGIFIGFFADAMFAVFLNFFVGAALGSKVRYLSYVGIAYILWLAVHILRSTGTGEANAKQNCNFLTGFFVQITNVKVILFCITALGTFVLPYTDNLRQLILVGCFLPFTGPICNLVWLFAGVYLQGIFRRHERVINIIMFIALILCALNLLR